MSKPSQWDQIIPCDAFNPRYRKTKVSLRASWICVILLPPFKAGSHTQRNTYESCKPRCIEWKNELWCYGNPKQQLLLPLLLQEWMRVNLIQSGRETGVQCVSHVKKKTAVQSSKRRGLNSEWILSWRMTCEKCWVGAGHQDGGSYMSRLPGADMDLSSLLLGHSKGLLKERFLSMALTKIWKQTQGGYLRVCGFAQIIGLIHS